MDPGACEAVLDAAEKIARVERDQAGRARQGQSLRDQFRFREYLERRRADPGHTFRDHLKRIGAAIEV